MPIAARNKVKHRSTEKEWLRFAAIDVAAGPLFETDADLYDTYLQCVHGERQMHDCWTCRQFIRRFGHLATIDDHGHLTSAIWHPQFASAFYDNAAQTMAERVEKARILNPFYSNEIVWGAPEAGGYRHFAARSPQVYRGLKTASQAMAAKREDYATVIRALSDFSPDVIAEAIRLLETGHFSQAEKFIAPLNWLADLHIKRKVRGRARDNLTWLAVATAPDGFCHPRSGVTGSLLDDIAAGMSFKAVKKRFEEKVHPLQYQRPQAPPKAQNIDVAEKTVEKLGVAKSLERRFARLDEVETAWVPPRARKVGTMQRGVFSHLRDVEATRTVGAPPSTMTWAKFMSTVLPGAEAIEVYVPAHGNFIALTTAVHPRAPVIMKWGNPFAWYLYSGGSLAAIWGLTQGWAKVNAIVPLPPMWGDKPQPHLGEGFVIVIDGAVDQRTDQGNALFPTFLIPDLYAVRSTIEAHSRSSQMQGRENGSACGLDVRAGATGLNYRLRVTTGGLKTDYTIDRWD